MNKLKNKIYIKQWLDFKPYNNQAPTDLYYLKICNKVKHSIVTNEKLSRLLISLEEEEIDLLACFLTSYFEDLISKTNIWNTFIKLHKKMYDKPLPFYETDEYFEEEINLTDISFLIWYFMTTIQEDRFIVPMNPFIPEIADSAFDVFDEAWEYAPENKLLQKHYAIDKTEADYYIARKLIDIFIFQSYLFYPDTLLDLQANEHSLIIKNKTDPYLLNLLNENRDHQLHSTHTRLLGLKGQEWIAAFLGEKHPLSKDFLNISKRISGYFLYKGQDNENVFLEHIASGKKFNITKKSMDRTETLKKIDTIVCMGMVNWKNEWWFSGTYFQIDYNPNLILDEKNSIESRLAVSFLDHQLGDMDDILSQQLEAFKAFNDNEQIAFMDSDKIEGFINGFTMFFNESLNLSPKEKEEAIQRAKKEGFMGGERNTMDLSGAPESGLVFFNPKSGPEVALGVNSAFPLQNNPFYKESDSEEDIFRLLFSEELSTELIMYCLDNCKNDLQFFESALGKIYLDNIDFLLRFWKRGRYFSKPAITFTGGGN